MKLFEFLEKYTPDYYQSELVANIIDIDKYFLGEMEENELIEKGFEEVSQNELFKEYIRLIDVAFEEALENYNKTIK